MVMNLTAAKKRAGFWVFILLVSAIVQYNISYEPSDNIDMTEVVKSSGEDGYEFDDEELLVAKISYDTSTVQYLEIASMFLSQDYYKITVNESKYVYWGELKDSIPNGIGIIMQEIKESIYGKSIFIPLYVGNFKDGNYSGYGKLYTFIDNYSYTDNEFKMDQYGIYFKEYEGYFKNGEFSGKGNYYINLFEIDEDKYVQKYILENQQLLSKVEKEIEDESIYFVISDLPPMDTFLCYYGEFKNGEFDGYGNVYDETANTIYEGLFKNGELNGRGKQYYKNGSVMYEGMFKNSNYNGKGTKYNKDGSIDYSGEWKNGDIK